MSECAKYADNDVDNDGAEPKDVGVGIFRPPRRLVRATVLQIGISLSFFYSVVRQHSKAADVCTIAIYLYVSRISILEKFR